MSSGPIAAASVRIVPDLTGFQALLQAEVNKAVSAITVPTIRANVAATAAATGAAGANIAASTRRASQEAAEGTKDLVNESNALRGSLIGLSRITPVTVFGLGAAGSVALTAAIALRSAVTATADFEQQLNTFQAVTKVSDERLASLREQAIGLGADTSLAAVSAGDAATALTELAKAGLSVVDSQNAVRGALELSGAAGISAGDAAKFIATQLNAFKLSGDQAIRVADLLAAASQQAQGEIIDFAYGFQQAASVAEQSGVSIEQTTAALTELAKAGITASDAGTSLRTFLLRLTPTTKEAAQYVKALGVSLDGNKTIGEQLPQIFEQYRNALQQLTPVQQTTVLNQIFGQDAIRAASVLLDQSQADFEKLIDTLTRGGEAAELNRAKAEGLAGAFASLKSNLDTLGISFGELIDGPLEVFVRAVSDGAETATELVQELAKVPDALKAIGDSGPVKIIVEFVTKITGDGKGLLKRVVDEFSVSKTADRAIGAGLEKVFNFEKDLGFTAAPVLGVLGPLRVARSILGPSEKDQEQVYELLAVAARQRAKAFEGAVQRGANEAVKENKGVRQRVAALMKKLQDQASDFEVVLPAPLTVNQLQAQLDDNLQAELAADRAIEANLRQQLVRAEKNPFIYEKILQALVTAHQATQSVLSQIQNEQEQAQAEQQRAFAEALANRRSRLELAADRADHAGVAEKALIAFYREQTRNLKLTAAERIAYERALYEEQQNQKKAIVEAAKAEIDRRQALFDLQEQKALLTPGTMDEKQIYKNEIAWLKHLQRGVDRLSKDWITYESKITDLKQRIRGLNSQGGFSLSDLFNEAVRNFETFGSNIAGRNGVLSRQDARAQFGKIVTNNVLERIGQAQLSQSEQQTALLASIDAKLTRDSGDANAARRRRLAATSPASWASWRETEKASEYGYGV